MSVKIGPNVKRLIIERASQITVERAEADSDGRKVGGVAARIADRSFIHDCVEASKWVESALAAVRAAPGGGSLTDEEIAGRILEGIAERKKRPTR